jgi:two-component system nitrate/nitrite response regulator NarL
MASKLDAHIRVVLVDVHRIVLSGLQRLVDDERPRMGVVATATSCAGAIKAADEAKPHVVVIDIELAQESDAGVIPALINGRDTRVLILSGAAESNKHELAILRGACGVVHKYDEPQTLIKAITKVHQGELWLDRHTTGKLFVALSKQKAGPDADPAKRKLASLTAREQDVVRKLVTDPGADNKTLATGLHIGEHTLRNHLSRIYDKLGVPNRVELYVFAQRHGLSDQLRS